MNVGFQNRWISGNSQMTAGVVQDTFLWTMDRVIPLQDVNDAFPAHTGVLNRKV